MPDFQNQMRDFETRDEVRARRALFELQRKKRRQRLILVGSAILLLLIVTVTIVLIAVSRSGESRDRRDKDEKDDAKTIADAPDWVTKDYLTVNEYSRPGTELEEVKGVVVHYVGNPGTTAQQNRNYFQGLSETHETSASSHFVVGLDGEIIQCVPLNEWSYCSNSANAWSIAIEVCHPDETGKFNDETYDSLVRLLKWLVKTYDLGRDDVIRHYDVTGKICPKYYVDNPDAWEELKDQVFDKDSSGAWAESKDQILGKE